MKISSSFSGSESAAANEQPPTVTASSLEQLYQRPPTVDAIFFQSPLAAQQAAIVAAQQAAHARQGVQKDLTYSAFGLGAGDHSRQAPVTLRAPEALYTHEIPTMSGHSSSGASSSAEHASNTPRSSASSSAAGSGVRGGVSRIRRAMEGPAADANGNSRPARDKFIVRRTPGVEEEVTTAGKYLCTFLIGINIKVGIILGIY